MNKFEKELVVLCLRMIETLKELDHDTLDYEIMLSMLRAKYKK